MRLGTPLLLAFVAFLILGSMLPLGTFSHAASTPNPSGYSLNSNVNFNTFGQFMVNETIHESTNSSNGINSVTFGFPQVFKGHITALSSSAYANSASIPSSVSTSTSNGTLYLTVNLQSSLQPGVNGTINLGFYVVDTFQAVNTTNYSAPILFNPSVNIPVDNVVSSIVLPYLTTHIANSTIMQNAGFSHTVGTNATYESWNFSGSNVSSIVRWANVSIYSDSSSSGSVDFTSVTRHLSVSTSGQVIVTDTIVLRNNGLNTLSILPYTPLTNSTSLTVVPSSDPPLSNIAPTTLTGGDLDLNSMNRAVEPSSSETIILQYPLGQQYWNYSGGEYHVDLPATSPVAALVNNFVITSSLPSGVVLTSPSLSLGGHNTTALGASAEFSYRLGVGSAIGNALPIASMLFIGVLLIGIVFRPKEESKEDLGIFDAMVRDLEDKVSGTNDILSELKSKNMNIGRNDLTVARDRIEEFRQKTGSKLASIRSQIPSVSSSVQSGLNEVLSNDREFDRVVRELLNNYDQFISKKMKEDTFARLQQNGEKRMQQVTNALLDRVHDLREEYESES